MFVAFGCSLARFNDAVKCFSSTHSLQRRLKMQYWKNKLNRTSFI